MPPQETEQTRWFNEHVKPHDAALRAWLRSRFATDSETDDIVQDAYMRVLRAWETGEILSPKAFLFATARNLAYGRLRRQRTRRESVLAEVESLCISDESEDVPQAVAHAEELEILTQAVQSLPTRCRQILTLRKIYGMSQKEVAARLGIAEHTVEAQGTIGLRKIAKFFERFERRDGARNE